MSALAASGASSPGPIRPSIVSTVTSGLIAARRPRAAATFGGSHVSGRVKDLALQIRQIDTVGVGERERSDTGGGEELRDRRAQPSDAHDERAGGGEALLRLDAELGQQDVPAVAKEGGVVQGNGISVHFAAPPR